METKVHTLDPDIAEKIGLEEAIIVSHFAYLIANNMRNGRNHREGRTWTYNSIEAIVDKHRYWSKKQVRRIMGSLIEQGVLIKAQFGGHDRRIWYAFQDETPFAQTGKCICPNGQVQPPKRANATAQTGKSIIGAVDKPVVLPVKGGSSQKGLSGQARSKVAQQDACRRLKRVGVDPGVAEAIVYEQRVDPADIRQAINNAMAKEFEARQSDLPWDLEPGYIIETLNTAAREGHSVSPSAAFRRMEEARRLRVRPSHPMRPKEFERNKQKQLAALGLAQ